MLDNNAASGKIKTKIADANTVALTVSDIPIASVHIIFSATHSAEENSSSPLHVPTVQSLPIMLTIPTTASLSMYYGCVFTTTKKCTITNHHFSKRCDN